MIVNDKMQTGYAYEYAAPAGKNFASGFTPELTPAQMLAMGVFEGHYLNDCRAEFPPEWFAAAKLSPEKPDVSANCFNVKSRMPLSHWRENGWITGPDPRGWFQWYCRYYMGRRILDVDALQIKRWRAFKRHKIQIERHCPPFLFSCRPRQRQALLQWAYDPFF